MEGRKKMEKKRIFRPVPGLSREEEEKQLEEILEVAQENLERTKGYMKQLSEELHDLIETYGPKDKQALALLHNTQSRLQENKRDLIRYQKARKKPYFGRIDFKDQNQPQEESYYIGRVGISKNGLEPIVIDWRAPVASVYYENALGPCSYTVKNEGSYNIDLRRKRTYEIAEDKLKDFFDSDIVATDDLLNKYLAKSKKAVLGEIIATIQKEQNTIIRKSPRTNLIVQGVAGSGKTTVAMHRISYILYNYKEEFRPEDFYIIGSNRILLNYITSVLPELDVYGVSQMTMEQLFVRLLYEDWDSRIHRIGSIDNRDETVCLKGSYEWFHDLEQFCSEYENKMIPKTEVRMEKNGVLLIDEAAIHNYLDNNPKMSMQSKINRLNEILLSKLENEWEGKYVSYTPEEKKELQRIYRRYFGKNVWNGSIFELYQDFLKVQEQNGKVVSFTENIFDLYDLAALAYLYKRIKETDGIREASHIIIDEAQDFGMMAYGALAYCLRGCTYTIMGDVSQNIHFGYGLNDWKELQDLILTGNFDSFGLLKKSYRNTVEISKFATEILRHGSFSIYPVDPIDRHGNAVRVTECRDERGMIQETIKTIQNWQKEGRETIAVICWDETQAARVSERLSEKLSLLDYNLETTEFGTGVMVLPVEYTKGLEFDAVLIYDPSAENYKLEDSYVKLLYVAATRALHELTVVHQGDLTDLIGKPVPKEKSMDSLEDGGMKQQSVRKEFIVTEAKNKENSNQKLPIRKKRKEEKTSVPINPSPYNFGDIPTNNLLQNLMQPKYPMDSSIRTLKKTKQYLDLNSSYGVLRLTPLEDTVIRVQFQKGQNADFAQSYWSYETKNQVLWTARAGKSLVEVETEKITIRIDKRTGAIQFFNKEKIRLLSEKIALPRRIELGATSQTWVYFDWRKEEKLAAKGILDDELIPMNQKARYISFGKKKLRMPLLVSKYGYGIGIAAKNDVICCNIPMYGTYLYTEGMEQIDYYFFYGESYEAILNSYKKL